MEKKYIFHFIKLANPFKTDVLLFEENSNDIIIVPLLTKWFKNYVGSEKINLNVNLKDLSSDTFQEIINNNYDLISNNCDLGRYECYSYFKYMNKIDIFNEIKNPHIIIDEKVRNFFISLNQDSYNFLEKRFKKIIRKYKISMLF